MAAEQNLAKENQRGSEKNQKRRAGLRGVKVSSGARAHGRFRQAGTTVGWPFSANTIARNRAGLVSLAFLDTAWIAPGAS